MTIAWSYQKMTFQQACQFLYQAEVEPSFFVSENFMISAPHTMVELWTWIVQEQIRTVIIFYPSSREVGLWVRPNIRQQGIGTIALTQVLADPRFTIASLPVYARTDIQSTTSGSAMRRILIKAGFRYITEDAYLDLWIYRTS